LNTWQSSVLFSAIHCTNLLQNTEVGLDQLMVNEDKLYVSYFDNGKTGIARLNKSFETEKNQLFDFPLMKSRFTKDHLYVLTQISSKKDEIGYGELNPE